MSDRSVFQLVVLRFRLDGLDLGAFEAGTFFGPELAGDGAGHVIAPLRSLEASR